MNSAKKICENLLNLRAKKPKALSIPRAQLQL